MLFYFSGTGNTRWTAQQTAHILRDDTFSIPSLLLQNGIDSDKEISFTVKTGERIGFAFPVYAWGPPPLVVQFIHRLQLNNYHHHYLYFICTCGDDIGLTHQVLEKELELKGWQLNAGFSMAMPDCYIALPGFDVDDDAERTHKLNQATDTVRHFANCILERKHVFHLHPGAFPWLKTHVFRPFFNRVLTNEQKFHVVKALCNGCGACARQCPLQNICITDNHPVWTGHCASCMACYHTCPNHAVHYGRYTQNKGQYLHDHYVNPHIFIEDETVDDMEEECSHT